MSDTIPVAVIGAGHMGRYHAQRYAKMTGVRVAAIIDADVVRAQQLAEPLGRAGRPLSGRSWATLLPPVWPFRRSIIWP